MSARESTAEQAGEAAALTKLAGGAIAANDSQRKADGANETVSDTMYAAGVTRLTKAMEDEIYSTLGALLGMLEVLSIDAHTPLTERQRRFVNEALRFGDMLRARVEALLTLFSDERDPRHQRSPYALRRLIDHSVRAASWAAAEKGVSIVLPSNEACESFLFVDAARVDRALRSITDTLVAALGKDGQVVVRVEDRPESVLLVLSAGIPGVSAPVLSLSTLMLSAWERLFSLQGGSLRVDNAALGVSIELPKAVQERSR